MKNFIIFNLIFLFSIQLVFSNSIRSLAKIETIRDIPWNFTGKAGNLFQTSDISLTISELISAQTENVSFGKIIYNKINGLIKIGEKRVLTISEINILQYDHTPTSNTVIVKTTDKFVPNILFNLKYDLISDSYHLKEQIHHANRSEINLSGSF